QTLTAISAISNLYAAPTNDQRYKTLNRYRVQLRRFDAFIYERLQKVNLLAQHSQGLKQKDYKLIEMVLDIPMRIFPVWTIAVEMLEVENTDIVLRGEKEKVIKRERKRTLRRAKRMILGGKKVSMTETSVRRLLTMCLQKEIVENVEGHTPAPPAGAIQ
ncbi:MAG: hypothetical protein Q9169_008683, partial [Polycauliona sp. 2 TL-2023]